MKKTCSLIWFVDRDRIGREEHLAWEQPKMKQGVGDGGTTYLYSLSHTHTHFLLTTDLFHECQLDVVFCRGATEGTRIAFLYLLCDNKCSLRLVGTE